MSSSAQIIADVVVIGSGAAGMSAAVSARNAGADVLVLERSDKVGGTSAVSGGVSWLPNNHHVQEVGAADSREKALAYLRSLSCGVMDDVLAETFVDAAPQVLLFLEQATALTFRATRLPDYHPEFEGGGVGRSLAPGLFPAGELGEWRSALRMSPTFPIPMSMTDVDDGVNLLDPAIIGDRLAKGLVGTGAALIAGLLDAALKGGVRIETGVRATSLIREGGVCAGVHCERGGEAITVHARTGVVIASGGFEWSERLNRDLLRGPMQAALSPPFNEGDGLLMAAEAGAAIANTAEAWWMPTVAIPGEEYEGRPLYRFTSVERASPGSIIVNSKGRRFVNEAHNYNDVGRAFQNFDPVSFSFENLPAWIILHQGFIDKYPFLTRYPGDPVPGWFVKAETLGELAEKIGIDGNALSETVSRFNLNASKGVDPDFQRGQSIHDQWMGDRSKSGPFCSLGPLDTAPFYACPIQLGALGTKGGPKINSKAQVIDVRGAPIARLFAAGNAAASPFGMAYPGAGGTLGPALVFGYIAGREAAAKA